MKAERAISQGFIYDDIDFVSCRREINGVVYKMPEPRNSVLKCLYLRTRPFLVREWFVRVKTIIVG